jgi:hypothetical protein
MKAVRLFIKYELSVADTIRELGYPTRNTLIRWYNEYLEKGDLHEKFQVSVKLCSQFPSGFEMV